ncbi:MAG: class I SAM-dependent methyltransferase [Acidobacteriota bacterium]
MEAQSISARKRLKACSGSPYEPEPPVKSRLVNVAMTVAPFLGFAGAASPHVSGAPATLRVAWEYQAAPAFWESVAPFASIRLLDGKEVLDVGCGWGGKMIYFAEHSDLKTICGFDLPGVYDPQVSIRFAGEKAVDRCFYTTGRAEEMPYPNSSFDLLLMEDVLEHVADPARVLAECGRVLRPGGTVLIKFPSFKHMFAHHLDRALGLPALHYLLSMKTWAGGLNYLRLHASKDFSYEPFDEVAATRYHPCITRNLNGLDFDSFREIIDHLPFHARVLTLVPYPARGPRRRFVKAVYRTGFRISSLREFLASFVLFVGEKGAR